MRGFREKLRTWRRDGFTLELWDTHVPTETGRFAHTLLAYRLSDRGRVLFVGDGFAPPLGVAIDCDECLVVLLSWFTLKPGDTDDEFFDTYTPEQRAWVESCRADQLAWMVPEMEHGEEPQGA